MAQVLYGSGISEFNGAIGGTVFANAHWGRYARNRTIQVTLRAQRKAQVRSLLGVYASAWRSLSDPEREGWGSANPGLTSGFHFFMYANLNRYFFNRTLPMLTTAPTVPVFAMAEATGFEFEVSGGNINRVAVLFDQPTNPSGYSVQMFCTPPLSPGVMYPDKSLFQLTRNSASWFSSETTFGLFYFNTFGTPQPGQRVFCQVYMIHVASGIKRLIGNLGTLVVEV